MMVMLGNLLYCLACVHHPLFADDVWYVCNGRHDMLLHANNNKCSPTKSHSFLSVVRRIQEARGEFAVIMIPVDYWTEEGRLLAEKI